MKKRLTIIAIIIFLAFVTWFTYTALKNTNETEITSGTVEALEIDLRSKIADRIDTIFYTEGDLVKEGDVLCKFRGKEIRVAVEQAKAAVEAQKAMLNEIDKNIANTKKFLHRIKSLKKVGGVSQQRIEDLELKLSLLSNKKQASISLLKQAEENLKLARLREDEIVLKSPISGVIVSKNFEKGELVPLGASILTIADYKKLWVNIYLPLKQIERLKLSQDVEIKLDAFPEKKFLGKIVYISKEAEFTPKTVFSKKNRENLVFKVKVKIENGFDVLKPGLPVEVIIGR